HRTTASGRGLGQRASDSQREGDGGGQTSGSKEDGLGGRGDRLEKRLDRVEALLRSLSERLQRGGLATAGPDDPPVPTVATQNVPPPAWDSRVAAIEEKLETLMTCWNSVYGGTEMRAGGLTPRATHGEPDRMSRPGGLAPSPRSPGTRQKTRSLERP